MSPFSRLTPIPRVSLHEVLPALQSQRPVIITGALRGTPAHVFSLESLRQLAGDRPVPVEYSLRPIYRPRPELNRGRYFRRVMSLSEAIDAITTRGPRGAWYYLSALSLEEHLPELLSVLPVPLLFPSHRYHSATLYLGESNTGSQLHYDITDNLLAVFSGKKRVTLLHPGQLSRLYPLPPTSFACNTSRADITKLDPRFPRFCALEGFTAEVCTGEVLYLPRTWWHHTVNEGLTLGVTCSWRPPSWELLRWRYLRVYLPFLLARLR